MIKLLIIGGLIGVLVASCTPKKPHQPENQTTTDSVSVVAEPTTKGREPMYGTCNFSDETFALSIDSCNCGEIKVKGDTVLIHLFQLNGGDVQQRWLKIKKPAYNSDFYLLKGHQNRMYVSSMGPDPILDDWMLYNSPLDTIQYNHQHQGFFIDAIAEEAQGLFPKFDTLELYKAYKRAVKYNLDASSAPDIAKSQLLKEYREGGSTALNFARVELHSIVLLLKRKKRTIKTIVFVYGHLG